MYLIKRRHFIQFASSTFATLGLSQIDIMQKGNRYAQVLSQSTPRKLALLVGINNYLNNERGDNLRGCITDVDLQEKLLTHRFGFEPNNILKLTSDPADKQPTRKNILEAFEEHLIKQAKPGDVVVFHFSGHGSRLPDPDPIQQCRNDNYNSTLVPSDDGANGVTQDIMGRTLFLLISALKTENVTVVLDSCFSGGGTRGNFIVRAASNDNLQPSPEEIAYQEHWIKQLNIPLEKLISLRCASERKGIVFAAAKREQIAADATFDGFSAGAFTYLMTQYLWQQTGSAGSMISQITSSIKSLSRQEPLIDGDENKPVYFIKNKVFPTDAVVIKSEGKKATLWLGGIDKESLEAFTPGATFTVINNQGQTSATVKLISPRRGLIAEAELVDNRGINSLRPGMLLQESTRVIPADLKLSIGLDPSLAGDTNAAKEFVEAINRIAAITAQNQKPPYPNGVQYIFSRMTDSYRRQLQQQVTENLPVVNSLGLFTAGQELVLQSFGDAREAVKDAVQRLEPKLKSLLATRILKKTLNTNSSELDVEVCLNLVEQPSKIIAKTATSRSQKNRQVSQKIYSHKLPLQQLFQFQVTNNESTSVYISILLFDSSGDLLVIFPYKWSAPEESMQLAPQQTLVVGNPQELKLQAIEKGSGEALIIVSRKPLKNAVKTMRALAAEQKRDAGVVELKGSSTSPDEVIGDLLNDLRDVRGGGIVATPVSNSDMATLSIAFEVN
ncbi:caspase family protein [Nostoc punctiforme]|uniref:Peptidase C14, caspase catalytic subunit p20 n=1 Tax=Nostoc punctiforme (strain ATCC 29133 / PCC 73102) TaxID=63737 RepID=B2JAJ9_NOSP7|nr:caspase family protein [Nostoc punctiforme]ACC84953.1 peptidase C14, caspase catalytic subunit p20 [Nostoc punctiforme PCC 73102]